jgi:hypothetical protein
MDDRVEASAESAGPHASVTLLPPQGTLDLYVTATDLHGFEVLVPTGAGGASQRDRAYGQVLEFRATDSDTSQFGDTATPARAFAARATSSFPGAFALVSIKSFGKELADTGSPISVAGTGDHFRNCYEEKKALLADPQDLANQHAYDLSRLFTTYREALQTRLGDGSIPLWEAYQEVTARWDMKFRKELLSRYLGFPLWDGLIFPTVALSELPQFTPIGVTQCSPLSARALTTPEDGKLRGVT